MIYSDTEILARMSNGGLLPFDENLINPASVDLRLGNRLRTPFWYWRMPIARPIAWYLRKRLGEDKVPLWSRAFEFTRYTLWPGQFVLAHSLETMVVPDNAVAVLFSKSSTGRIGIEHLHAGYGDPGFAGQWTWELQNIAPWPVELVAGKRLMQVVFAETTSVPDKTYGTVGHYQNQAGPTVAR